MRGRSPSKSRRVVTLSKYPESSGDLTAVRRIVFDDCTADVLLDFSAVERLTYDGVLVLMTMDKLLYGLGHRLILCAVPPRIMCVFRQLGVETLFVFAKDTASVPSAP